MAFSTRLLYKSRQDWRSRRTIQIFQYVLLKWAFALIIGLGTELFGIFNNIAVENISGFKLLMTTKLMLEHNAPLASTPVWERDFSSSEELITEFCRECRIVRKGLNGDLKKAMKDGKPIIIEGSNLNFHP